MVVFGYTDNVGAVDMNMDLSQKRAQSVRDYLVTKGIPTDLITAQGKGPAEPVAEQRLDRGARAEPARRDRRQAEEVVRCRWPALRYTRRLACGRPPRPEPGSAPRRPARASSPSIRRGSPSRRSSASARCSRARGTRTSSGRPRRCASSPRARATSGVALPPSYSATRARRLAHRRARAAALRRPRCGRASTTSSPRARRGPTPSGSRPSRGSASASFACFDRVRAVGRRRARRGRVERRHRAPAGAALRRVARPGRRRARGGRSTAAADIPDNLRDLLVALGFNFDDPIVGRIETGDTEAIEALLGPTRTREVRGDVGAPLRLERQGVAHAQPRRVHAGRGAPHGPLRLRAGGRLPLAALVPRRELLRRGRRREARPTPTACATCGGPRASRRSSCAACSRSPCLPARRHHFRAAAGRSADDFYLLGRTGSTSDRSPSLLLHVVEGQIRGAHSLDEPLTHLHVTADGTVWGLSHAGTALRFAGRASRARSRSTAAAAGAPRWYGIGGTGSRVLVWGAGALLEFDGERLRPLRAARAELEEHETVVAVSAQGKQLSHARLRRRRGRRGPLRRPAVAAHPREPRHRGAARRPRRVARHRASSSARSGEVWRVDEGAAPPGHLGHAPGRLPQRHAAPPAPPTPCAASTAARCSRATAASSRSGSGEPVFHAASAGSARARSPARVGGGGERQERRRPAARPSSRCAAPTPGSGAYGPRRPRTCATLFGSSTRATGDNAPSHGAGASDPAAGARARGPRRRAA